MAERLEPVTRVPPCPQRPMSGHKGTFGTVVVVGGCETMSGAPAICAGAALRAGAGLAKVAAERALLPTIIAIEPSATGTLIPPGRMDLRQVLDEADPKGEAVVALGPGIGRSEPARARVLSVLRGPRSVVLDADGLNALSLSGKVPAGTGRDLVLTPHPGEFRRLAQAAGVEGSATDPDERPHAAARLARAHEAVVVLKGHRTVVTDGQRAYLNPTGGPALATAGTGDVLTGVIASLIGQGLNPFDAAVLGTYLHGLAGDRWTRRCGPSGLTAAALIGLLPEAMHEHRGGTE